MKKISKLLALFLTFTMLLPTVAFAQSANIFAISTDVVSASAGETVDVTVNLNGDLKDVAMVQYAIKYDSSKFTVNMEADRATGYKCFDADWYNNMKNYSGLGYISTPICGENPKGQVNVMFISTDGYYIDSKSDIYNANTTVAGKIKFVANVDVEKIDSSCFRLVSQSEDGNAGCAVDDINKNHSIITLTQLPAICDHDMAPATCTTPATCQIDGCGYTEGEIDENNHDIIYHDAKAPTATEIGWEKYETCSRCDYTTYEEIPALGEDTEDPPTDNPPTDNPPTDNPPTDNPPTTTPSTDESNGWEDIKGEISGADKNETVVIDMNGAVDVPSDIFEEIAQEDVEIVFNMGDGISWVVHGKDVPDNVTISNVNLNVKTEISEFDEKIPSDVIDEIQDKENVQIELDHSGNFGFTINLNIQLGVKNAGLWANLYYYNPVSKKIEFVDYAKIGDDGVAQIPFMHASNYVVVVDNKSHNEPTDNPPTDNPPTDNPPTDNPPTDNPPTDNPPTDNPPTDNPPTDNPPTDNPPTDNPPTDNPPTDNPPTDNPPTDNPPTDNPPTDNPPTDNPPTDNPPTDNPPTDNPPTDNPPTDNPPTDNPPTDNPPTDNPPTDNPPTDNPPTDNPPTDNPCETGHSYGDWIKVDDNNHKRVCDVCGEPETEAHTWDTGVVTTPATNLTTGVKTYTCTAECGATKTEVIPRVVHSSNNSSSSVEITRYTVKFDSNGGSYVASKTVKKNGVISMPAAPTKEGYTFAGWYTDQSLTNLYDFATEVTSNFTLYAKWTENEEKPGEDKPATTKTYTDVKETDWYYEAVKFVSDLGLMTGVEEEEFAPELLVTRAMLATILYRNEGEPAVNRSIPFADIDMSAYYANAVIWAHQNGIVKGITETEFAPNQIITREQIVAMIFRYAQYKGMATMTLEENLAFADAHEISEYAVSAMNWAVGCGLIKGRTENTVHPRDNATRAELATILYRFLGSKY